jgi:hypothetical protein
MKYDIVIPFPEWDGIAKANEIAAILNKIIPGADIPNGFPRRIKVQKVAKVSNEDDRLKITYWFPMWGYITIVIAGYDSSFGTGWNTVGFKAQRKKEYRAKAVIKIDGEAAELLDAIASRNRDDLIPEFMALVGNSPIIETKA